ncbi:MAG: cytochrome b/b6 domain-containing protein [Pseudomonadota bacterium]
MSRALATRYQPVLVALHWIVALMILGLLCLGFFVLDDMPNTEPHKLDILKWHMAGGMLVLPLMLLRLAIRLRSARPPQAQTGSPKLDKMAALGHRGFYAIIFLMIASGFFTGYLISGAYAGGALPASFDLLPSFRLHSVLAGLLVLLIGVHLVAALYHHVGLKDGLLGRMWFGKRTVMPER